LSFVTVKLQVQEYDSEDIPQGELYPAVILQSSARNTVCVCVQDADGWKFSSNTSRAAPTCPVPVPINQVPYDVLFARLLVIYDMPGAIVFINIFIKVKTIKK